MKSRFCFVAFAILALSLSGSAQHDQTAPQIVSMVQLLSSPERYDGKTVVVFGFLTIGQEDNNLYLGKGDYDNVLLANSIWVDVSREMLARSAELNLKYVRIVGVFRLGNAGHHGIAVGGLGSISDCRFWSAPDHPLSEKFRSPLN
jgi:hypothetical protein